MEASTKNSVLRIKVALITSHLSTLQLKCIYNLSKLITNLGPYIMHLGHQAMMLNLLQTNQAAIMQDVKKKERQVPTKRGPLLIYELYASIIVRNITQSVVDFIFANDLNTINLFSPIQQLNSALKPKQSSREGEDEESHEDQVSSEIPETSPRRHGTIQEMVESSKKSTKKVIEEEPQLLVQELHKKKLIEEEDSKLMLMLRQDQRVKTLVKLFGCESTYLILQEDGPLLFAPQEKAALDSKSRHKSPPSYDFEGVFKHSQEDHFAKKIADSFKGLFAVGQVDIENYLVIAYGVSGSGKSTLNIEVYWSSGGALAQSTCFPYRSSSTQQEDLPYKTRSQTFVRQFTTSFFLFASFGLIIWFATSNSYKVDGCS